MRRASLCEIPNELQLLFGKSAKKNGIVVYFVEIVLIMAVLRELDLLLPATPD